MAVLQLQFYLESAVDDGTQTGPHLFVTGLPPDLAIGVLRALTYIKHESEWRVRVTHIDFLPPGFQVIDEIWDSAGVQYAQGDITELAQQMILTGEKNSDDGLRSLGERVLKHTQKWTA